jgi:hypothetical protein
MPVAAEESAELSEPELDLKQRYGACEEKR